MFDSKSVIMGHWLKAAVLCLTVGWAWGFTRLAPAQNVPNAAASSQNQSRSEATQTPATGQAVSPYAGLTRQEVEEFLLKAKVIRTWKLSVGVAETKRATLDNGKLKHDAHIQTVDISKSSFVTPKGTEVGFRDYYKYNIAAYELAKLLDFQMIPPSVERSVAGTMGSLTWWIDDAMMELDRRKRNIEPPDITRWNQQVNMRNVFSQLVYDTDPNQGNILITKDWRMWRIDSTRAFRTKKTLDNPKTLLMCDRQLLAKLRELNKDVVKEKLKPYLTNWEIDGLFSRRDLIVKFFDNKAAQKGESAALFDYPRDPD